MKMKFKCLGILMMALGLMVGCNSMTTTAELAASSTVQWTAPSLTVEEVKSALINPVLLKKMEAVPIKISDTSILYQQVSQRGRVRYEYRVDFTATEAKVQFVANRCKFPDKGVAHDFSRRSRQLLAHTNNLLATK